MLRIQFSNRIETLCDALVEAIGNVPASPFSAQQIVVPSSAMRRHLTLAIAERHGICANVEGVYLAQWLWSQIARVVRTVSDESPFAASALEWRIYQILGESTWNAFPRLANYLKNPGDVMRFELAADIGGLFEQYITYRQDWMNAWLTAASIPMPKASPAQRDDQAWQAELWRRIADQLGAAPEHPAAQFLRSLATAGAAGTNSFGLPESVHVFCLPAMPPLYLEVLTGLARWVDVTLYVLNPCQEYWFDIVDPKRLRALAVRGAATHHETGNRLLASWGKQTKAHIELLLDRANDAPLDDAGFDERYPDTLLGRLQHAIFTLTELEPASLDTLDPLDRSIEVHVCHSLTRELEVLQDQLLALFAGPSPPGPADILIVTPDLETAAPLIDASSCCSNPCSRDASASTPGSCRSSRTGCVTAASAGASMQRIAANSSCRTPNGSPSPMVSIGCSWVTPCRSRCPRPPSIASRRATPRGRRRKSWARSQSSSID